MAKGGARSRSGPPPDPNALRRERDSGEWIELPKAGRDGPPPAFPLPKPLKAELELWGELWSMPQAIMWAKQRQELEVAQYVRRFVEGTQRGATVAAGTLVRQLGDSLGLTTPGLRAARWKIVDDVANADRTPIRGSATSMRDRLRVVSADGGA